MNTHIVCFPREIRNQYIFVTRKISILLLCFSMKYRDFSGKSKLTFSLFQTLQIRFSNIHCFGLLFFFFLKSNSSWILGQKHCKKVSKIWNYVKRLRFCVWTADVTYCFDVTFFLHVASGRVSAIVTCSFCLFLTLYCFTIYLASFFMYKNYVFYPILCPYYIFSGDLLRFLSEL